MSKKNCTGLAARFAEAGLELKMASEPFGGRLGNKDVFGMDIQRKFKGNTRSEFFRIWKGHEDNRVEVLNIDKKLGQLVLLVHEPERRFSEAFTHLPKGVKTLEEFARYMSAPLKDVFKQGGTFYTHRRTPSHKRHFLCGVDERQLFIAQLPAALSTVRDAHESLKSTQLTLAEGQQRGRTVRQGEWFFVNATEEELEKIKVAAKRQGILHKTPIDRALNNPRGGKPHTAEEVVVLNGENLEHGHPVRTREIFVRGKVRHEDHATVSFKSWRKVIRNAESGGASGVHWVD